MTALTTRSDLKCRIALATKRIAFPFQPGRLTTMTFSILGKRGSGKTYLATVLAEEMLRYHLPFVALDPAGAWYGLRARADGLRARFKVLTVGGANGELPLRPDQGRAAASLVVGIWPDPVVVDVSRMPVEEQRTFVADFAHQIYETNRRPLHVFLDEGDEFAPQRCMGRHQRKSLGAVDRLVRRGRVKGIGVTLIGQRPATLHKNVLSQVDGLFLLNMVSPSDLNAAAGWLDASDRRERASLLRELAMLGRGYSIYVHAGGQQDPIRFQTRRKTTFDSSAGLDMDHLERPPPNLSLVEPAVRAVAASFLTERHD